MKSSLTVQTQLTQAVLLCFIAFSNGKRNFSDDDFTVTFNVGNPWEFTMFELADIILYFSHRQSRPAFKQLLQDDPRQRRLDISLAQSALGWEPQIKLAQGLEKTISYFCMTCWTQLAPQLRTRGTFSYITYIWMKFS
jgi:nucleoside-diphosphate-sugar epimerase